MLDDLLLIAIESETARALVSKAFKRAGERLNISLQANEAVRHARETIHKAGSGKGATEGLTVESLLERFPEGDRQVVREAVETALRVTAPGQIIDDQRYSSLRGATAHYGFSIANLLKDHSSATIVTLLENEAVARSDGYRAFCEEFRIEPRKYVVGVGQSGSPDHAADVEPILEQRPGRSVSNLRGWSGSLGLYVERSRPDGPPLRGFTSASHVLNWDEQTRRGATHILSPGPPPETYRTDQYRYGLYESGRYVIPYANDPSRRPHLNQHDIAWALLEEIGQDTLNVVPDPQNPRSLVPLRRVMTEKEFTKRFFATPSAMSLSVYKVGHGSGFTAGKLIAAHGSPVTMRIKNMPCLYDDLIVVEPAVGYPCFSKSGDSGSVIYTDDFEVVGFVVGASGSHTFGHLASPCLNSIGVTACLH